MIFARRQEEHEYHKWFAWRPVWLYGPDEWDRKRFTRRPPRLVWLRFVERMRCEPRTFYALPNWDNPRDRQPLFPEGKLRIVLSEHGVEGGGPPDLIFVEIEDINGKSHECGGPYRTRPDGLIEIEIDLERELNRLAPLTVAHHPV